MACDCAGQSYSYDSTAVNQCIPLACPLLYQHRDRAALAISGSPAHLSSLPT